MLAKRGGGGGHHGNSSDSGSLTHIEAMVREVDIDNSNDTNIIDTT